jgi:hypothetical protein
MGLGETHIEPFCSAARIVARGDVIERRGFESPDGIDEGVKEAE